MLKNFYLFKMKGNRKSESIIIVKWNWMKIWTLIICKLLPHVGKMIRKRRKESVSRWTNRIQHKLAPGWVYESVLLSWEIIAVSIPARRKGGSRLFPWGYNAEDEPLAVISLGSCKVPRNKVSSLSISPPGNQYTGDDPCLVSPCRFILNHRRESRFTCSFQA